MFPQTFSKINHELEGKEFVLQHTKRGYRCISWHPHYIMTDWVKSKERAIRDGDLSIQSYYENNENFEKTRAHYKLPKEILKPPKGYL